MTGMPASLAFCERRQDGLVVLGEQDEDLGTLRDEGVDVGQLLLVARGSRRRRCTCRRRPRRSSGCSACHGPPSAAAGSCSTTRRRCSRSRRPSRRPPLPRRARRGAASPCSSTLPGRPRPRPRATANLLLIIAALSSSSGVHIESQGSECRALGYHPPVRDRLTPYRQALTRRARRRRSEPRRRIGQERLERELGGAAQRRVDAELRRDDPHESARRREGATIELRLDDRERRTDGSARTARRARRAAGSSRLTRPARPIPSQRPISSRAPRAVGRARLGLAPGARRPRPGRRSAARPARRRSALLADLGLPAADRPAAARQAVRVDRHVADLAAVAGGADQRLAVDDEPAADADLARQEQDVVGADGGSPAALPRGHRGRPRWRRDRDVVAERARELVAERRRRRQPRLGAIDTTPSVRRTTPTTATPIPIERVVGRSAGPERRPPARPRSADDLRRPTSGRAAGRPGPASRTSPPRPTTAAASESTSMSRARTTALRRVQADERRRPAGRAERRRARSSVTRSAAASSPIRPRIALRVRPVRATSSERESGTARVQLADDRAQVRPADRLAALSELVPSVQHAGLCSSLPKVCARLVHGGRGVKMRARGTVRP